MANNIIQCPDVATLVTVCAALVREGVTFTADADRCTVTLTGGY